MPNTTQDQINNSNGHIRHQQITEDLGEKTDSSSALAPSPSSTRTATFVDSGSDWSPVTQELMDGLPQVWTRGLLYLLLVCAGIVLPWAMLSRVDETGKARGRLEPAGNTQRLDSPVTGKVVQVRVKEGQTVKTGQVLMELESDILRTNLQQAETRLEGQQNRLAQLELIKNQLLIATNAQTQQNKAQELEKQAQIEQAQQNLAASKTSYNLQEDKLAQIEEAQRKLSASQTAYILASARYDRDMAEVQRFRKLWQEGVVPEVTVVQKEQLANESRQLREQAQAEIKLSEARLKQQQGSYQKIIHQGQTDIKLGEARLKEQRNGFQSLIQVGRLAVLKNAEQLKNLQAQLSTLQAEIAQTKSQIKSLQFQLEQRILRSPIEGTIFQLPIERAGAVVQPGQMIAQLAPQGAPLVLRAQIPSQESGFLKVGMPVKVKFDAYPFQDYGIINGRLNWIAPDSKITETAPGKVETFEVEIVLDRAYIQSQNKRIALTPGQTATAEVTIRQRRVIDFVLDPFKKLQKDGLQL